MLVYACGSYWTQKQISLHTVKIQKSSSHKPTSVNQTVFRALAHMFSIRCKSGEQLRKDKYEANLNVQYLTRWAQVHVKYGRVQN